MEKTLEKKRDEGGKEKKIEMLKCWVVGIEPEYLVMRPMKGGLLDRDLTVTYTVKRSEIEDFIKLKDEVVALNVHKLTLGWRAKTILIPVK